MTKYLSHPLYHNREMVLTFKPDAMKELELEEKELTGYVAKAEGKGNYTITIGKKPILFNTKHITKFEVKNKKPPSTPNATETLQSLIFHNSKELKQETTTDVDEEYAKAVIDSLDHVIEKPKPFSLHELNQKIKEKFKQNLKDNRKNHEKILSKYSNKMQERIRHVLKSLVREKFLYTRKTLSPSNIGGRSEKGTLENYFYSKDKKSLQQFSQEMKNNKLKVKIVRSFQRVLPKVNIEEGWEDVAQMLSKGTTNKELREHIHNEFTNEVEEAFNESNQEFKRLKSHDAKINAYLSQKIGNIMELLSGKRGWRDPDPVIKINQKNQTQLQTRGIFEGQSIMVNTYKLNTTGQTDYQKEFKKVHRIKP